MLANGLAKKFTSLPDFAHFSVQAHMHMPVAAVVIVSIGSEFGL